MKTSSDDKVVRVSLFDRLAVAPNQSGTDFHSLDCAGKTGR